MTRPISLFFATLLLAAPSCTILPKVEDKEVTRAIAPPRDSQVSRAAQRINAGASSGESSFLLLEEAKEGFEWRLALIDSATSSVDIQLYLWHRGASSTLLFWRALQAADRGVRVRILVDDFLLHSNEPGLASLCELHPNFDVRIFNPGRVRGNTFGAAAEWLTNYRSLNRRMHNKTFTVDRSLSIVGGRNVGDHYYGMDEKYNFIDLDVLASGPVVRTISDGFDDFWNSSLSFPASRLTKKTNKDILRDGLARIEENLDEYREGPLANYPTEPQDWSSHLGNLPASMHRGRAVFIQDHPEVDDDNRDLVQAVEKLAQQKKGEMVLVSPYLLPRKASIENLNGITASGVNVKVLTASLEANNQPLVDGHYRKIRPPLVDNGAELFEFRPDPSPAVRADADITVHGKRVTLHSKTIVIDRRYSFIGSLNLDPRALDINTESGLFIDSKPLARELGAWLDELCSDENSWKITRNPDGKIQWESRGEVLTKEPPAKWSRRMMSRISGLLPIRSQL